MKKHGSKKWFKKVRGSYLPSSFIGFAIYLTYTAYLVLLAYAWYSRGCDLWLLLTVVLPLSLAAMAATQYVASKHSK